MGEDPQYALGKLSQAVTILATGEGDVRSRLRRAYGELGCILSGDLPPQFEAQLEWIRAQLTKRGPAPGQDELTATLYRMRNRTGSKIAARLVSLEAEVAAYLNQREVPVRVRDQPQKLATLLEQR
jgi:hypothetical protein